MCLPVTAMMLGGCLWVLLIGVSSASELPFYKKVGDEVVLKPNATSGAITNIMWRHGQNIACQWDGEDIDSFRQFQGRTKLNITSGELTITGLTPEDSGTYTADINDVMSSPIKLTVIFPVPTPTLSDSCDEEKITCTLTCDGNTTAAEPVTYNWKFGDSSRTTSSKTHVVTKDNSSTITEFSCELQNPVSKESSQPILNPFSTARVSKGGLKINTGLTVFICLLTAVLLLVLFHRWKAGMWFFQKASMPWEADFWRKERQHAAVSNGVTAPPERTQTEEETPMT